MTDFNKMIEMLVRAGFRFEKSNELSENGKKIINIEVYGCFYDSLSIMFDAKTQELINMVSHVAYNQSSCEKAREYYQVT